MKKKRVETFRKIYGMVTVDNILLYRQRAQVVRLGGLAPARPIIYIASFPGPTSQTIGKAGGVYMLDVWWPYRTAYRW